MPRTFVLIAVCGLLLTAGLITVSCTGVRDLSTYNQSEIYRTAEHFFLPQFAVVHNTDTTSTLYVRLDSKKLLFSRQSDDKFRAYLNIHYRLTESYEATGNILDSATVVFEINEENKDRMRDYTIPFRIPKPGEYLMEVILLDVQKKFDELFFVNVDNSSVQCRQSFFVRMKNDTSPLFNNQIAEMDSFQITWREPTVKKLHVSYYNRNFPLAPPPFSFHVREEFDYKPDSTFYYEITDTGYLSIPKEGFYHFRIDTTDKKGFTLYRFQNSFPNITSPDLMVEAVRYVTTKREFEEMKSSPNKKASMDKFWIELGGSPERSKLLIRKYYTRVREANRFFTSYTEGWRTDRGMIYLVMGRPNNVYKSRNSESWIYGTPNNALSINFFFIRVANPFCDNDYALTREQIFEGSWMRAVDVWRQGRVYNDN